MLLTNFLICGFVLFSLPSITGVQHRSGLSRRKQSYQPVIPLPERSLDYPSTYFSRSKPSFSFYRETSSNEAHFELPESERFDHSNPDYSQRKKKFAGPGKRHPSVLTPPSRSSIIMQYKQPPKSRTQEENFDALNDIDFKTWKPTPSTTANPKAKPPKAPTTTSKPIPKATLPAAKPKPNKNTDKKSKLGHQPPSHFLTAQDIASLVKEEGREGETLRLTCPNILQSTFPQRPDVVWTSPENMELKAGHTGARHLIQPDGALIIHQLTSVDRGAYKCSFIINGKAMKNGTVLVSIEDCSTSPCMNGGVCEDLASKTKSKLFCRCPDAYEGRYCENKKNLWILLVPFVGSAVVLLAIIAVIVRFTCFKKKKPLEMTSEESQRLLSTEGDAGQKRPPSLVKPLPPLRTTPSGHLPFYDVQTQSGDPAYWPDKRFSYEKFQDGVVTQTGNVIDYGGHRRGSQWVGPYAAHSAQTLPFYDQYGNEVTDLNAPYPEVPLREVLRQPSNEQYLTNVPVTSYGSREWYPQPQTVPRRSNSNFNRP